MADLEFNIKASFDEVAKARQELGRLRQELKKTTAATDPVLVKDLMDQYDGQSRKVRELTSAMSRYAIVTGSDFKKKMQSLTRECYNFELQADASKRKIEKLSSEIGNLQRKQRQGGLDAATSTVYQRNEIEINTILNDEKKRYENLVGSGKQARLELQNMQAEYVKYSGSSTAATDNVKTMTDAFANMIDEMKKVPTVGEGATSLFNRLGGDAKTLAMSLMGGLGFEQLAQHVFNVRSEFQQLEISFTTMLGSEQKAGALMDQLINTAAKTPFDMSSITNGAKQLLAYGTAANEVNDILVHLGDISAGLNVPLGDLVYLYGTTMAQGRMYTMDLRQFMGRGIPMAEELGKLMGKTTQEVQEAVSKGKVGADLVKKAIEGMTAEGGKFGGLMEKQSATLQGKWSNIGDTVDQMFNEIGKKSEGVFGTGLDLISSLVDNWETVVKVIGTAVVAVGTYKAGLMAAASIQKAQNQATIDGIASNLDEKIKAYKDEAELYHSYTDKDTSEYKNQRLWDLNKAVANTDMLGTDKAEELVSLKIKEAQTDGIITQQMAEQLQLKRDMLVAQQQSAAKEQMEALELSKGLDEKMSQFKEMENDYRHLNGKDTKDYKASRYNELGNALADTEKIGDDDTEERISKQIELAKSEGLISDEMAKQLQLKRDLLVEQTKLAEKEQLQWQNAVNAKEAAEEEVRAKRAQEAEIAAERRKEDIEKANKTPLGQAILNTNSVEEKKKLAEESVKQAKEEAAAQWKVTQELGAQIKKQEELVEAKKQQIKDSYTDVTDYGGYEDDYGDNLQLRGQLVNEYAAEQEKLNALREKAAEASKKAYLADCKVDGEKEQLKLVTEELNKAVEDENRIYEETGAEADEINQLVSEGVAAKQTDTLATDANSKSKQSNTTSESANTAAKNANADATVRETTTNVANTTSEATNTAATNTNTTSENVNTGAKQRNTLVTGLMSVGTKAATLAQTAFTWATNTLTASLKGLWAAMLANPLTTVITLVSTAISVFSMFGSEEEDAGQKTQDMGNKAAEASNKVRSLFALLNTGSAEDHKDTINELKSAYEEYGIKLDETKMKSKSMAEQADELKAHEEELIGIIEKRSIEMERANQLQQAYDNFGSSNDAAFADFKEAMDGKLSNVEMGTIRSMISQDDLDKLAELRKEMSECGDDLSVYNALNAEYAKIQGEVNVKLGTYLENMGHNRSEVAGMIPDINSYTDTLVNNTVALKDGVDEANNSADAAERARKATSKLTYAQEEQALKNQFAKKTFKELNSDIQQTIKLCSKKIGLDIKVNYDDSELPAWIKKMSNSQLKASMAARKNWLDGHKKGDVMQVGSQYKTYEQVATELAMMQARGTNVENKPQKTQKELDKEKKAREKAAKAAEKARNDAETKAGNRKKAEEDYAKTVSAYVGKAEETMSKNRIAAMKDGYEKEVAQINENAEKERKAVEDGIDKLVEARKKKDQTIWVNSGKNRKANMWKQEKSDEEYRKEVLGESMRDDKGNEVKNEAGKVMTIGESVQKQMDAINEKAVKQNDDALTKEAQSMYEYLKDYGTYQEQKLAIAADYAKKIKDVEDSTDSESNKQWKIKSLQEQQKKDTDSVEASAIMQKIDWYQVFGNVGGIMKDSLSSLLSDLDKFVGTDKFQSLGADQQKSIVDAMANIRNSVGNTGDLGWKDLAKDLSAYQEALRKAKVAQEEYAKLETQLAPKLEKLQEQLGNAKKAGNVQEQTRLQNELNNVQLQLANSGQKIVNANNNVRSSGQKLAQTTQNVTQPISAIHEFLSTSGLSDLASLWDSFDQLKGGIDGLKALDEAKKAADGLKDMGKEAADAAADVGKKAGDALGESLSKAGLVGQITSAILKILDVLRDGIGTLISNLIDTVLNSINGILSNILSGDFITQIGSSLITGVGNILNTVTFGGFNSLFGVNGNEAEIANKREALIEEAEKLTKSIDCLKSELQNQSGAKAISTANELKTQQEQLIANAMQQIVNENEYHSAHHSNAYYWGNNSLEVYDHGSWAEITKALQEYKKKNANADTKTDTAHSYEDLQKLTPEQMNYIRTYYKDQWQAIKDVGKYDASDEKWEAYADLAGTLQETVDSLNEALTKTTFDSLKSEFISTLMDMDSSASDFSDKFSEYLMQAVLDAQISNLMDDQMESFYKDWAARAEKGNGTLSTSDIAALKKEWDDMVQQGLAIRDQAADITGYKSSYSQSASSGAFESMSQDTGEELNGRFAAVQIATEGTYQVVQEIDRKLGIMLGLSDGSEVVDEGVTKIEAPAEKETVTPTTAKEETQIKLSSEAQEILDNYLASFSDFTGSSEELVDEINTKFLRVGQLFGHHSLEYKTGLDTSEIVAYFDANRKMIEDTLQTNDVQAEDSSTSTITSVYSEMAGLIGDVRDSFLDFVGSSEDMLTEVNAYRKASGKHSLEYATGMSTDDLVAYIEKNRVLNDNVQSNDTSTSIASPSTKEDNESFLSANISSITANVGNMWLAVDEGRTILAQSLMCLQSIDERQDTWHKPMLQAFSDIHELKDKMSRL